jgi:thiamine-phosphate diphosphorylase / hydroxyethylthiazole kinase
VPILINDRVDIALAIHADGVHLGQTDMPVSTARSLLPKGSIIGVSCNTKEHIKTALQDGADYVGIGAVWGTLTKALTSPIIGVRGVGEMLKSLDGTGVRAVAIGMSKIVCWGIGLYSQSNGKGVSNRRTLFVLYTALYQRLVTFWTE